MTSFSESPRSSTPAQAVNELIRNFREEFRAEDDRFGGAVFDALLVKELLRTNPKVDPRVARTLVPWLARLSRDSSRNSIKISARIQSSNGREFEPDLVMDLRDSFPSVFDVPAVVSANFTNEEDPTAYFATAVAEACATSLDWAPRHLFESKSIEENSTTLRRRPTIAKWKLDSARVDLNRSATDVQPAAQLRTLLKKSVKQFFATAVFFATHKPVRNYSARDPQWVIEQVREQKHVATGPHDKPNRGSHIRPKAAPANSIQSDDSASPTDDDPNER